MQRAAVALCATRRRACRLPALPLLCVMGKEVHAMMLDMTAQLAPMLWVMLGTMVLATAALLLSHE